MPGIFSRDTLFSHGNHEPGWIVAPGMQGIEVQPFTQTMLAPESLAELLGGPDIVQPPAPPAFGVAPGGEPARPAERVRRAQPAAATVVSATGTATRSGAGRNTR